MKPFKPSDITPPNDPLSEDLESRTGITRVSSDTWGPDSDMSSILSPSTRRTVPRSLFQVPDTDTTTKKVPADWDPYSIDEQAKPEAPEAKAAREREEFKRKAEQEAHKETSQETTLPALKRGEGYFQALKRAHPEMEDEDLVKEARRIKKHVYNGEINLSVGQQLRTVTDKEEKSLVDEKVGKKMSDYDKKVTENKVKEEQAKAEKERKAKEDEAKAEKERKAKEEESKAEKERKAKEELAKAEKERKAKEDEAKAEKERKAKEEQAKAEKERKAKEDEAKAEKERKAKEEEAKDKKEREAFSQKIVRQNGASPEFTDMVHKTMAEVPPKVQQLLEKNGFQVVAARRITDEMPELKGVKPFPNQPGDWDTAGGALTDWNSKRIVIPEYHRVGDEHSDKWEKMGAREPSLRHEVGHAVDSILGDSKFKPYSGSDEFNQAYQRDIANIPAKEAEELKGLIGRADAGDNEQAIAGKKAEAAAEIFAALNGGSTPHFTPLIRTYFPATAKVMEERLKAKEAQNT